MKVGLAEMLVEYRKHLGLSQTDFAKRYGFETATSVSYWEREMRSIPNIVSEDILYWHLQRVNDLWFNFMIGEAGYEIAKAYQDTAELEFTKKESL